MNFRQLINGLYNWINASPNLMFMALKIDCDFKTFETDLGTERFFMQLKHRFKNIIVNCEFIKRVTSNGSEDEATILFYLPYYYGNNYIFSKPDTILSCELNYYEELPLIFYRRFYNSILDFVDPIVLCCGYEKEECKDMYKEEPKENNWLKNSVIEKEFKEIKDNERRMRGGRRMNKKLGELTINKTADYYDTVVETLEEAGYVLVLEYDSVCDRNYIIAKAENEEEE